VDKSKEGSALVFDINFVAHKLYALNKLQAEGYINFTLSVLIGRGEDTHKLDCDTHQRNGHRK
jgi:hypothetical protein